jgi:Thiamine pyrophosphate enzyme, N-terminal TPP binding domain
MKTQAAQDIPFIAAPRITTVAGYLLTRLAEVGVRSVFGVPGDCNLPILDAIAGRPELAWIGMATGQGAGYAAGSYARLRGIGALVTTFGAGELSATNAIAGACAQSVPVVHIVGTPALAARQSGATLYRNLPGRDCGHFARMAAEVTAAQADLRPDTAPEEIDRVLNTALRTSRPVYLTIPADMADIPVLAPAGRLAGHLAPRRGEVHDLAVTGNLPVAVLSTANDVPEPRGARADLPPPDAAADARGGPFDQRKLWARVRDLLRPGDLLIADQGTAFYGAAGLTLPSGAELIASRCRPRSAGPCRPPWARRWPRRTGAWYWSPAVAPCGRPRPSSAPSSARAWHRSSSCSATTATPPSAQSAVPTPDTTRFRPGTGPRGPPPQARPRLSWRCAPAPRTSWPGPSTRPVTTRAWAARS